MNNFDEWFKSEMPNTYAKKDSEKIEALVYSVALAAWNVQQARIDSLKKMAFNLKTDLIRENHVEYDKGWKDCATSFYHEILKGESK